MTRSLSAIVLAAAAATSSLPLFAADRPVQMRFYVDPQRGSDQNPGNTIETPFRSIEKARDAVRAICPSMSGDILVFLRGGDYVLKQPIALNEHDSGSNGFNVVYCAYESEVPCISGEQTLGPWTLFDSGRNIYCTQLSQPVQTRQLFVDGRRAVRARSIGGLADKPEKTAYGYTTTDLTMASWKNTNEVEFVYRQIWTNPRCGIQSVAMQDGKLQITMKTPGLDNARTKGITSIGTPWYIENAYELLDEPGEWYLDNTGAVSGKPNMLFYKPHSWEKMDQVQAVVPVIEHLVTIEGSSFEKPAHNITFSGLMFRYTTWLRPSSNLGVPDAQNNVMREHATKTSESIADAAALTYRYAKDMEIRRCTFTHLGSIGIAMYAGAQNSTIEGCRFTDISANGVQIGDYLYFQDPASANYFMPPDARHRLTNNRIANNYFNRCGVEYRSATALGISFPRDSAIVHNEIYNMPYSGMHLGWAWATTPKTIQGNNLIEANKIQNVMVELADGASFYTLGSCDPTTKPTIIRGNYARQSKWGQAYYFDENSSYFDLSDNVAEAISDSNLKINGYSHHINAQRTYVQRDHNTIAKVAHDNQVEPVIVINDSSRALAEQIKANAGLEPAFTDVRPAPHEQFLYEAEEAELAGGAATTSGLGTGVYGYSGMGYVENASAANATITFNTFVNSAGNYTARIRYAAPKGTVQGMRLSVNGQSLALPEFQQTKDKNSWNTATLPVTLRAGANTIVIGADTPKLPPVLLDTLELLPQ